MESKNYNYRFTQYLFGLDMNGNRLTAIEEENDKIVIYIRGEKRLIDSYDFIVSSPIELTKEKALDLIKGTKGYILTDGKFADLPTLYTTSDNVELKEGDDFFYMYDDFIGLGRTCPHNTILFASSFPVFGEVENAIEYIKNKYDDRK